MENNSQEQISLKYIVSIIFQNKKYVYISVLACLLLAIIYGVFIPKKYESQVLLKKEKNEGSRFDDNINDVLLLKTGDETEAEIEILRSRSVLDKVINELKLGIQIDKIYFSALGKEFSVKKNIRQFLEKPNPELLNQDLPKFSDFTPKKVNDQLEIIIKKISNNKFAIYNNTDNDQLLDTFEENRIVSTLIFEGRLSWNNSQINDRIHLSIKPYQEILKNLNKSIEIERKGKTNIFQLTINSTSPYMAMRTANSLASKYRETRFDQKRQTINYTYDFVDDQLQDISGKLNQAEEALSKFKSTNKIVLMDENAKDIIDFLGNLQKEKIETELELTEYRNKLNQIKDELSEKGYFDQTYLTPTSNDITNTPFSSLLEQLSDSEIKRLELLQKRKENHPDVIAINDQIIQIKEKLSEYNQNTITSFQIIINSLQKKVRNLNRLIAEYNSKIDQLPGQESVLAKLLREKNAYEKMFTLLLDKREELRIAGFSRLQDIVIIDSAQLPLKPVSPRNMLNLALALVFGTILGVAIVIAREYFSPKVMTITDIEKFDIPILAIFPPYKKDLLKKIEYSEDLSDRFIIFNKDETAFIESFKILKTRLLKNTENGLKPFLITSCEEGSGKTTIAANMAISFSESNKRVVLVDLDLRKPKIADRFDIGENQNSLNDYLQNKKDLDALICRIKKHNNHLPDLIISRIDENADELLNSSKMDDLINFLSAKYDVIILDTAPVTRVVDTLVAGKYIKDAFLVIRPNFSFTDSVNMGIKELNEFEIKVNGLIINDCDIEVAGGRYKYGYGYGYSDDKKSSRNFLKRKKTI